MAITDDQIRDLRIEAREHGDCEQELLCSLALGESDACTPIPEPGTPWAEVLEDFGLAPEAIREDVPIEVRASAREKCAAAIDSARCDHPSLDPDGSCTECGESCSLAVEQSGRCYDTACPLHGC